MKRWAALAALALPAAQPALAQNGFERVAIDRLELTGDPHLVAMCMGERLAKHGNSRQYQLADGLAIAWGMGGGTPLAPADGSAKLLIELHGGTGAAWLRVMYRRPFSRDTAVKFARDAAKRCFPVDWDRWAVSKGEQPTGR